MPTIHITPEQDDALARGETITVAPPKRRYIAVFETGNVFDILTTDKLLPGGSAYRTIYGDCRLIAKGCHPANIGHTQRGVGGKCDVIEVPLAGRDS